MEGLSVIVPAYNEENEVGKVLRKLIHTLPLTHINFEIIAVNDASTDGTLNSISGVPGIILINNPLNIGYGAAIKKGLQRSLYDKVAIIDADNTYPVEEIPALLHDFMNNNIDMIVGERKHIIYPRFDWIKQRGRDFIDLLCSYLAGNRIPDINSGLRLFKKEIALRYINNLCDRFSFTTSLTLIMFFNDYCVKYIKVGYCMENIQRRSKVKMVRDGFKTLYMILKLGLLYSPFKTILFLGSIALIMFFISLLFF